MSQLKKKLNRKQLMKIGHAKDTAARISIGVLDRCYQLFTGQKLPKGMYEAVVNATMQRAMTHQGTESIDLTATVDAEYKAFLARTETPAVAQADGASDAE